MALGATLSFRTRIPSYRIQDATDRLQAQLRASRVHATSHARQIGVSLNVTSRTLRTEIDMSGNGIIESNEAATVQLSDATSLGLACNATSGVFTAGGEFMTSGGYWRIVVSHAGAKPQYVYVFQSGHVQASEVTLD
ncbi:MAG: hypothetical protein O3B24_09220 [Verrucomicrobia bacterium]|nr:hypothetical protein [Verrucomicrobiota bacterium]